MTSEDRMDKFARINWRYLCGPGAPKQPRGTFTPVVEPFVDDSVAYFGTPLGDWVNDAACAEADPRLFDCDADVNGEAFGLERGQGAAAEYCAHCPVAAACLTEGARMPGLWGGDAREKRPRKDRPRQLMASLLREPEPTEQPKPKQQRAPVSAETKAKHAAIRAWASANGWVLADNRPPPRVVRDAYEAEQAAS